MSNTSDFFKRKKEWSKTKDYVLGCYLVPYFQKMMSRFSNLVYVDCFAGKGKFDDGEIGSPLIALDALEKTSKNSKHTFNIKPIFIESNYAAELLNNVNASPYFYKNTSKVVNGKFEHCINSILENNLYDSLFLYVDPYGIKELDVNQFNCVAKINGAKVEMLININTWGFIREACRIMSYNCEIDEETEKFLLELDNTQIDSIEELNRIAGGDYWQPILAKYNKGVINSYEAENMLAKGIENALWGYKYVLNIPVIPSKTSKIPKYRLFHLTNHKSGCVLMANTMFNAFSNATVKHNSGQQSLFNFDFYGTIIGDEDIKNKALSILTNKYVRLEEFKALFFIEAGICCSESTLCKVLKQMEKDNLVCIHRNPDRKVNGERTSFMKEVKGKTARIKLK